MKNGKIQPIAAQTRTKYHMEDVCEAWGIADDTFEFRDSSGWLSADAWTSCSKYTYCYSRNADCMFVSIGLLPGT